MFLLARSKNSPVVTLTSLSERPREGRGRSFKPRLQLKNGILWEVVLLISHGKILALSYTTKPDGLSVLIRFTAVGLPNIGPSPNWILTPLP